MKKLFGKKTLNENNVEQPTQPVIHITTVSYARHEYAGDLRESAAAYLTRLFDASGTDVDADALHVAMCIATNTKYPLEVETKKGAFTTAPSETA